MSSNISRNFNSFGKAFEWLLDQRGMSQVEFSEKSGVDEAYISKYKSGKANPPRGRRIKRFGDLLNGKLERQPNGTWTASMDEDVKDAIKGVEQAEEQSTAYTGQGLSEDDLVQSLELAQRLIGRSLTILKKGSD